MLSDLDAGPALVDQAQALVVEVAVQVALGLQELDHALLPPGRPVMRGEGDVRTGAEQVDRLGQRVRPGVRIPHDRAAQGEQVVQGVGGVLGGAQRPQIGEMDEEFGGRLGVRSHLEHHTDPVDNLLLPRRGDGQGRRDQGDRAGRGRLPEPGADLPPWSAGERRPVHIGGTPAHRRTRVHVLGHGVLGEVLRRDDRHTPGIHVLLRGDALDPAEVVDVRVRVDDAGHRALAAVLPVQRERRRRGLGGDQRIDHEHAGAALDERDVRQVEPAHLVDALGHLEQTLLGDQLGLPPQARVHGVGGIALKEGVRVVVPHDGAVIVGDSAGHPPGDQPAHRILEVLGVGEREALVQLCLLLGDERLRRLGRIGHSARFAPGDRISVTRLASDAAMTRQEQDGTGVGYMFIHTHLHRGISSSPRPSRRPAGWACVTAGS